MPLPLVAATLAFSAAAGAASVLSVEQISGEVHLDQLGQTRLLQVGDELHDRDVLRVAGDAYLSLRFAHEGALELGPGAALAIERLPAAQDAPDLRSIFSLWQGYMHIVWKHPANKRWPLFVYFGGQRTSLVDGEYFFERAAEMPARSCVAAGKLTVNAISGDAPETLLPSACYEMRGNGQLKTQPRELESWVTVRQSFTLDPDPAKPLHVFPARELAAASDQPVVADTASASAPVAAPPTAIIFTSKKALPAVAAAAPVSQAATMPKLVPPPPAAPPLATPAVDSGASWAILIGSYADPQNAAQVQQKLLAAGFTPFLRVKILDGRTWNSVQVRGYATREAADAKIAVIGEKLGLPNLKAVLLP